MNLKFFKRKKPDVPIRDREYYISRFRTLTRELCPPSNQADTKQGEMLRCVGNLKDESSRNGNANWDEFNEEEVDFLMENLPDLELFDKTTCEMLRQYLTRIRKAGRSGHGQGEEFEEHFCVENEVFYHVMCRVIDWCDAHPDLIEIRVREPNLHRFEKDDDGL